MGKAILSISSAGSTATGWEKIFARHVTDKGPLYKMYEEFLTNQ